MVVSKVETRFPEDESEPEKLSDLLKVSWIKTALNVGIALIVLGLVIIALLCFQLRRDPTVHRYESFCRNIWTCGRFHCDTFSRNFAAAGKLCLRGCRSSFWNTKSSLGIGSYDRIHTRYDGELRAGLSSG